MSTPISRRDGRNRGAGGGARRGRNDAAGPPVKKEEEMDELLAVLSHELRMPTTAILGWAELMGDRRCDGDIFERGMEVIKRNARLQERLIKQLFDFTRAGVG